MDKYTIGTDIKRVYNLSELSDFDLTSIKQLRCYVINTDEQEYVNLDNFGYPQYYSPTEYDINYTNKFRYNWLPYNQEVYNSGMFGPIDDYRIFPTYNGFGVRSKQFKIIPTEYLCPSRVLENKGQIEMYFPAQDQRRAGKYKVVIVLTIYESGWGSNNLRTVTIDKGEQFILEDYK